MPERDGSALQMTGLFGPAMTKKCSRYKSATLQLSYKAIYYGLYSLI